MLRLIVALTLTLLIASPVVAQESEPPERPNILWITSEDNSAHWIGCYGNRQAKTPHIDRLASEGIRFTRAYSNGAVCAVARSALFTGVHAITQGTQQMRSRYPIP
jgi:N-sulfoglucosamine sulfohydrolase